MNVSVMLLTISKVVVRVRLALRDILWARKLRLHLRWYKIKENAELSLILVSWTVPVLQRHRCLELFEQGVIGVSTTQRHLDNLFPSVFISMLEWTV